MFFSFLVEACPMKFAVKAITCPDLLEDRRGTARYGAERALMPSAQMDAPPCFTYRPWRGSNALWRQACPICKIIRAGISAYPHIHDVQRCRNGYPLIMFVMMCRGAHLPPLSARPCWQGKGPEGMPGRKGPQARGMSMSWKLYKKLGPDDLRK